ncbi:MAG: Cerebroside-sulfatase [Planctomycetaceae bacterium]|nr:Cerebroside-sulfatase [Planctomycetaceae bacterium]|tara:strand:- start:124 stop:1476 length:1353 start_codon:yes stop_codon:yes gene_type:complete
MKLRRLTFVFTAWFTLLSLCPSIFADVKQPPNIVFLFADDLGYADLGCYGHPYAKTPAIDSLAEQGTIFTQFYVTGVTCSPSRTGAMTGIFPARFPKYPADFGFGDRVTVTEMLQQRGYKTGHFGKWHMGPRDKDGTYGIDKIETIGKSNDAMLGRDDDLYTAAIQFINENKDGPFYVNVWGHATHFPVNTPPNLVNPFQSMKLNRNDFSPTMQKKFNQSFGIDENLDESMRQYLGDVYQIDLNVGRLLKALDDLEIANNTIVVFSSDHGPAPVKLPSKGIREYSKNMLGYAGPFRGGKHTQLEGGVRVPFIIRWPGHVTAGRIDTQSVGSFIDWLPTVCSIAGVKQLPTELDGEDISNAWLGKTHQRQKALYWKTSATSSSPSMRVGNWKLHMPRNNRDNIQLYNLVNDPGESQNVANQHPEVISHLRKQLRQWVGELPTEYKKLKQRN